MTQHTISTTIDTGINLSSTGDYSSPLTITATGVVNSGPATGIYSKSSAKITNYGIIESTYGNGIVLYSKGMVKNFGTILAPEFGAVYFKSAGLLINKGIIKGGYGVDTTPTDTAAITVHNYGVIATTNTFASAIYAVAGGTVTNSKKAILQAYDSGVSIFGKASAFVTNSGLIDGFGLATIDGETTGNGVYLASSKSNILTNTSSGAITAINNGVVIQNASGTVINAGYISGQSGIEFQSATLSNVGYVQNSGEINANSTVNLKGNLANGFGSIGVGVYLANSGTVINNGLLAGNHVGVEIDHGTGLVKNTGLIKSTRGYGVYLQDGGSVSNSGAITSRDGGITIEDAPGRVTNSGYISGHNGIALGGTTVSNVGYVYNSGSINAYNSANINGFFENGFDTTGVGVYLANSGTVVNIGALTGNHVGIVIERGYGVVKNTGTIISTTPHGYGVYLQHGGSVNNSGVIRGSSQGLFFGSSDGLASTLINSGYVSASLGGFVVNGNSYIGSAVFMVSTGTIDNTKSGTFAAPNGLGISFDVSGNGNVSNEGLVKAAYGIDFYGIGGVRNTGTVIGSTSGIDLFSSANVVNSGVVESQGLGTVLSGTITASAGGVVFFDGGVMTNASSGIITAAQDGVLFKAGPGTILNAGDITGNYGIVLESTGEVTNLAGGKISSPKFGVVAGGYLSLANAGLITATGTTYTADGAELASVGVVLVAGGSVTNSVSGTFTGYGSGIGEGIDLGPAAELTRNTTFATSIVNSGTIEGGVVNDQFVNGTIITSSGGIALNQGGAITNEAGGIISGHFGAYINGGAPSIVNSLTNFGTITGVTGIGAWLGANASLTNSGLITGTYGAFLTAANSATNLAGGTISGTIIGLLTYNSNSLASTVINQGQIIATSVTFVTDGTIENSTGLYVTEGGTIINSASGTISGSNGAILIGDVTATNAGTITGRDGLAVYISGASDELIIDPNAVFNGLVYDATGSGILALGGSTTGTISGIGSAFIGFSTLNVNTGAVWDITGANTIANVLNTGTIVIGGGSSLDISSTLNAASSGVFMLTTGTLEIGAALGSTAEMQFLGTSANHLIIDSAGSFGTHIGTTAYAGPLLLDFGVGDSIDISGLAGATVSSYSTVSGDLQISKNGSALATLQFQNASLGAGNFHTASDAGGGLLITHN